MKKVYRLLSLFLLISMTIISPVNLYADELDYPVFKQVVIWGDTAFAVSEDHSLYYWGADPRVQNGTRTREPVKYMDGVSAIRSFGVLKDDGNIVSIIDGKTKPDMTETKAVYPLDLNHKVVLDKGNLIELKEGETSLISENVAEIRLNDSSIAVLKMNGELWSFELYGEKKATLISENVRFFDVSFMGRLTPPTTYYFITNDNTLWCTVFDFDKSIDGPFKLSNDVQQVSCSFDDFLATLNNGKLIHGNYTKKENKQSMDSSYTFDIKNVLDDVSSACNGGNSWLAIKTDGTIWYWGIVIGGLEPNPQSRSVLYETQPKPVQLSFDPKVNLSYVRSRMEALLTKGDRLLALGQFYDYYAENLPEKFTADELESFKKYSQKALDEKAQSSSELSSLPTAQTAEPVNTPVTSEPIPQSSDAPNAKNSDKEALAFIMVVLLAGGACIISFIQRRNRR